MIVVRRALLILLAVVFSTLNGVVAAEPGTEQQNRHQETKFTGLYRKQSVNGRPETVRITDGKTYIDVTVEEYRERGYEPPYERLPTQIIRRLPVRIPVPVDEKE